MDKLVKAKAAERLASQLPTPQGRYEVGQKMLEPFKEGRDYVSIGRKVLAVHHIEPGAPIWYDLDAQFSAVTIGNRGGAPRVLDGKTWNRVELVPFPIVALVRIGVEEPAIRRFDVLDRSQVRAQAEMAEVEDEQIFSVLRTAAASGSGVSDGITPPGDLGSVVFNATNLASLFAPIEDYDVNVEHLLMKASTYKYFRSLLATNPGMFDPVSRRELLKTGYMGDFWQAQIRLSKKLQTNEILAVASPEFTGVVAIRIDLSQMDSPMSELLQYGWLFYEFIAPAILTNVGVARLTVSGMS
jgi:hypothetical protein